LRFCDIRLSPGGLKTSVAVSSAATTKSMKQSPSCKDYSRSAGKEIPWLLRNPKIFAVFNWVKMVTSEILEFNEKSIDVLFWSIYLDASN
jgi:hypothetical protein